MKTVLRISYLGVWEAWLKMLNFRSWLFYCVITHKIRVTA